MVVGGGVQTKKQRGAVLSGGERMAGWWFGWSAEREMRHGDLQGWQHGARKCGALHIVIKSRSNSNEFETKPVSLLDDMCLLKSSEFSLM